MKKEYIKNITMTELHKLLCEIYFGDTAEQHMMYILPLKGNWVVPTADPKETVSTWIGYQISEIRPQATRIGSGNLLLVPVVITIRLWTMGKQAEEFITDVLFWDYRQDIKGLFGKYRSALIQGTRKINSIIYSQEGFNSEFCWFTDLRVSSYYSLDMRSAELEGVQFIEPESPNAPDPVSGMRPIRNLDDNLAEFPLTESSEQLYTDHSEQFNYEDSLQALFKQGQEG